MEHSSVVVRATHSNTQTPLARVNALQHNANVTPHYVTFYAPSSSHGKRYYEGPAGSYASFRKMDKGAQFPRAPDKRRSRGIPEKTKENVVFSPRDSGTSSTESEVLSICVVVEGALRKRHGTDGRKQLEKIELLCSDSRGT